MLNLGTLGASLVLGIAALGSGIGINIAGQATIGAWKKCFLNKKPAQMMLIAFTGNPLTQVFYAYILMNHIMGVARNYPAGKWVYLAFSLAAGIALMATAIIQGKLAANSVESLAETGKGFAQYMTVMGVAEAVALFAMVLTMTSVVPIGDSIEAMKAAVSVEAIEAVIPAAIETIIP